MASPYKEANLAIASLVSLWPLEEAEGNALDTQGLNNGSASAEGLTRAQTSLLPNGEGKSCKFDGAKGWFSLADTASLDTGDTFSVAAWIKFSTEGTNKVIYGGPSNGPEVFVRNDERVALDKRNAVAVYSAVNAQVKETVYHFVCVKNGATRKAYINGAEIPVTLIGEGTVEKPAGAYGIGRRAAAAEAFWAGHLQYVSLFNAALTAGQIEALYAAGSQATSTPPKITRKPPLELDVEVETPDGTFRQVTDSSKAGRRPLGLNFGTQRGDGFATGGYTLSRQIFRDYSDINLLDTHRFIGKNGEVAYEGRLHSNPRTNDPQQQISLALVGWMTHLKGQKIAPLIIDRRLDQWGEPSTQRKANVVAAAGRYAGEVSTGRQDAGAAGPAVILSFTQDFNKTYTEVCEAWFYAGGEDIGKVRYDFTSAFGKDEAWTDQVALSSDDLATATDLGTDHNQVSATNQEKAASTTGRKYAYLFSGYGGEAAGAINNVRYWPWPRVIGNHGLTLREEGTQASEGYYLSEIIEYILRTYFPKVEWAGQTNTFPVTQFSLHDAPTDGWTAIQTLNNFALFETNMWEGPSFHFEQADLTSYDWQIKTTDPGVTVLFEGDSIEEFANGIAVTYTDILTGRKTVLYPPDHEELRDDSESNPANRQGEALWTDVEVPNACLEPEALQYGRAYLAEFNRPKRPGTYRISGGYIRDYAGHWQQGWRPRCSETLGILDHPEDAPRLITATQWDQDSLTLTITTDAPPKTLEAIVARQEVARTTRSL